MSAASAPTSRSFRKRLAGARQAPPACCPLVVHSPFPAPGRPFCSDRLPGRRRVVNVRTSDAPRDRESCVPRLRSGLRRRSPTPGGDRRRRVSHGGSVRYPIVVVGEAVEEHGSSDARTEPVALLLGHLAERLLQGAEPGGLRRLVAVGKSSTGFSEPRDDRQYGCRVVARQSRRCSHAVTVFAQTLSSAKWPEEWRSWSAPGPDRWRGGAGCRRGPRATTRRRSSEACSGVHEVQERAVFTGEGVVVQARRDKPRRQVRLSFLG